MKRKSILNTIIALSLLGSTEYLGLFNTTQVHAATTSTKTATSSINSLNTFTIQNIDPYIKVVNNQYVLQLPSTASFSSNVVKAVQSQLLLTNTTIKKNHSMIDPTTKEIVSNTDAPFFSLARRRCWGHVYWF
ncbi:hypothetical protein [Lactobacillus sp. PV012]|uniref:hypothetical protein n=1 Tax=Lactobacillus sp. PV012 TaxID=2594494 RepID=UPI00223FE643|nr:hypothetical protein [Lactobacillus sp. PV012]QNQ81568.1 hypothetical protein FP433_00135 [Lactobacillus sp. PV012]